MEQNNNVDYKIIRKRRLKIKNLILLIILLLSFITLIISLYNIFNWNVDNKNINKQVEKINDVVKIENVEDNDNTQLIKEEELDKSNPYWDYIKMNMIDVDFYELKKINNDTKGWIQVLGTNVNYPFVQAKDNDYYLNHAFDKSKNGGGWVFLDYRNDLSKKEKNTIIYGHGRENKTIFGSLKNILESNWVKNPDNYVIKLSTEYENTLWQIFSIYRIPTTNDYIQTKFDSDFQYLNFINKILDRSDYDFKTSVDENDQVLTLSTCYNNDDKFVIHAKLIKREIK